MAGTITAASISGSLDAKNLAMAVLTQANQMSGISQIFPTVQVPELTATIPLTKPGSVAEDVQELETTDIDTGTFLNVDFSLKKDRVKLAVSDEARYKSKAGDPLALQIRAAGAELARTLDKKVITALQTTPQTAATQGAWSTVTNSPLADATAAEGLLAPYKIDFCAMPQAVYAKYMGTNLIGNIATGNPSAIGAARGTIPGYDCPIFIDANVTAKTAIFGSASGMAAVIGQGPVKVREWDDPNSGATIYQIDVYRQVKSTIFRTSGSLNQSAYVVTAVIA
jgi:hypothetical protein